MNQLYHYIPYISFWLLNSFLVYFANVLRPQNFELGSATITENLAFLWVGAWLTFIGQVSKPILSKFGLKLKGTLNMFLFYWAVNSATLWFLARLAEYSGFGISRFYWAIVLGFVTNLGQWLLHQALKSYKLADSKS